MGVAPHEWGGRVAGPATPGDGVPPNYGAHYVRSSADPDVIFGYRLPFRRPERLPS
jgi:hypothetical protein